MHNYSKTNYTDLNLNGERIVMYEKPIKNGYMFYIGTRFESFVKTTNPDMAFDFFRNYATMLNVSDLKYSFQLYKKAIKQHSDGISIWSTFWKYKDGCY